MTAGICTAHSDSPDTPKALEECVAAQSGDPLAFSLLLHGPNHTNAALLHSLDAKENRFYGCSTSGEILPGGYTRNSMSCLGFSRRYFCCVSRLITNLRDFGFQQAGQLVPAMKEELRKRAPQATASSTVALLLIDSSSRAEEFVAAALGSELGNIQLVGGSSGDNWRLGRTPVLFERQFHDDSAVLLMVHSALPFRHYNFHNFVPTQQRGVITAATPSERLVHEINGAPALSEYARLCGLAPRQLDKERLALHPAIITVGDRAYPRGFAEILPDGSLRSACAIDEGVVFRVAAQVDYVEQMRAALHTIRQDLGERMLVLAMECAARREMVEQQQMEPPVAQLFDEFNVWGLNCMGEQSNSLHMNNSFNCLAFALPA